MGLVGERAGWGWWESGPDGAGGRAGQMGLTDGLARGPSDGHGGWRNGWWVRERGGGLAGGKEGRGGWLVGGG
eukprot:172131-Chlamydomonas_euryale.AAC.1